MCEYLDKQLTKTVLGQTMTADRKLADELVATLRPEFRSDPFTQALTIKMWMEHPSHR